MLAVGKTQVYTGPGLGRTLAALGLTFRTLGRENKVYLVQFLKSPDVPGGCFHSRSHGLGITFGTPPRLEVNAGCAPEEAERTAARMALKEARRAMMGGGYALVILGEVNDAVNMGLLPLEDLLDFMADRPSRVELVLTGSNAHPEILARADLVSEVAWVKCPRGPATDGG